MDAKKLKEIVNTKTLEKLGEKVIKDIDLMPTGKVKINYYNGNVKWFINFFQCFHTLNYQYNLKIAPAKTSFAKLKEEVSANGESQKVATLKVRLINEFEIIIDRYKLDKMKYFKNTIFKEMKEVIYDDSDIMRLSKKEFNYLKNYVSAELYKKYGGNGYVNDILRKFKDIDFEELFN